MSLIKLLPLLILMILLLSSCSNNSDDQGIKMVDLYQKHSNQKPPKLVHPKTANTAPKTTKTTQRLSNNFVREQQTELENQFPKLPNPTLNMFIYPHLTKQGHPVPGYSTNFRLYQTDQYALPTEVF